MSKKETVQKEDVIQAVVIADAYTNNFQPLTSSPCLMPLVNRPLIDYTLECLSLAHVQEVILFCTSHTEQIKQFVKSKCYGRMTINVVVSDGCRSLGDAMRDLDAKALIKGDFILLCSDVVGNFQIVSALDHHRKTQKVDKGASMTLMYKQCGGKVKSQEDDLILALNSETNRILLHERRLDRPKINLEMAVLLEQNQIDFRNDLLDCKVSVCSINVPPLFTENFDFQTRDDFVRGVIMNEEILASTVYAYILPDDEYTASVTSWQNYHYISHDIIHRWSYPLVPDLDQNNPFSFNRNNIYLQDNISLAKGCCLEEDVVVGRKTVIKEQTTLSRTVVGPDCKIGANVAISGSHVFSKVTIENNCHIHYCVIGEGCTIKSGTQLKSCVVGPGVVLGPGVVFEKTRLECKQTSKNCRSFGSKAFSYHSDSEGEESESDSEDGKKLKAEWRGLENLRRPDVFDDDTDSDEEDGLSRPESPIQDDANLFYSEVVDSLLRGYEDNLPCDNLVLEVNSSRYAYNIPLNEVNYYVVRALITMKNEFSWDQMVVKLKYFMPLLTNYIKNESAMLDCLNALEDIADINPPLRSIAMKLIHLLYNKDILAEEVILKWFETPKTDSENSVILRKLVKPFIQWLEEAESDDDDDDDDD